MSGEEFDEKNPFGEGEDLISLPMVKKATHLIHKLADRRGADFKEIQKKCKKLLAYENLAKVSMEQGHAIIDKLVALTGGEEQQQGAKVTDDGTSHLPIKPDEGFGRSAVNAEPMAELEKEIGHLSHILQICVHNSKEIFKQEFGKENITEGTRAMLVKSFAATIFIEAGKRGIGR
jgi:hypothetical protein